MKAYARLFKKHRRIAEEDPSFWVDKTSYTDIQSLLAAGAVWLNLGLPWRAEMQPNCPNYQERWCLSYGGATRTPCSLPHLSASVFYEPTFWHMAFDNLLRESEGSKPLSIPVQFEGGVPHLDELHGSKIFARTSQLGTHERQDLSERFHRCCTQEHSRKKAF